MPTIGTQVSTSETPPAISSPFNTANAFFVGVADWGPSGAANVNTPVSNLAQAAAVIGGPTGTGVNGYRSATNATLFDSLDAFFREGGTTAYISRVLGASGTASATLALAPSAALTLTAQYSGVGGNNIFVVVNNSGPNATVTLQDSSGNQLFTTGAQTTLAALVSSLATSGLVTAASSGSTLPSTITATQMAGGSNGTTPTLTQWTTAINCFGSTLGPGQILAPGVTNTSISGIWNALLTHASLNNRVAILDETDGASTSTVSTDLTTAALATGLQGYGGMWAGNRNIPGITSGTTRTVPPSPIIAALCARVDNTGNPNLPPAGPNFSLQYATSPTTVVSGANDTYSPTDLNTLNGLGVNSFQNIFGIVENRGFVTLLPPTTDLIYWQFNHARTRMAQVAKLQAVAEKYFGAQVDGLGATISDLNTDIQNVAMQLYNVGALYGQNPTDAFQVNTGAAINPPALLAAGTLSGQLTSRLSPGVQLVSLVSNAVPITQTLVQLANPAQNQ